jgi:hypothetical protein
LRADLIDIAVSSRNVKKQIRKGEIREHLPRGAERAEVLCLLGGEVGDLSNPLS